jgi:hypothetical protein
MRLIPNRQNSRPDVTITSPKDGQIFSAPAMINLTADASDTDGTIMSVEFLNGSDYLESDASPPYNFTWDNVPAGTYRLKARAIDNAGSENISESVTISVTNACTASGTITREYWNGISGSSVLDIPVNDMPDGKHELPTFEGPANTGTNYGARISGYVCAPSTGSYVFWISSNDHSELWLSSNDDASNKQRIAFVAGATSVRQWDKFSTQRSAPVLLTAGKSYFIEALHKQGAGAAHVAVGWQLPNGSLERPIPASRLSPLPLNMASPPLRDEVPMTSSALENVESLTVFPNPVREGGATLLVSVNEDMSAADGAVEIMSVTGEIVHAQNIVCQLDCNRIYVDITHKFAPGIYLVNARIGGRRFWTKFLVSQ